MVGDTCVPSLIVINTTIMQLKSEVSLLTTYCLRLFVIVYKDEMLYIASEVMVGDTCVPSLIVIDATINQLETNLSITICCLRLFVVVYKHVM